MKQILWPAFRITDYDLPRNAEWRGYEDKIIAAYPIQRDLRVFNQQSVFTIHNSVKTLECLHEEITNSKEFNGENLLQKIANVFQLVFEFILLSCVFTLAL